MRWSRRDVSTLGAAVLVALSFGLVYGVSNQNTYFLSGLRRIDPTFLANDWLAASTYSYHPLFSYVLVFAAWLGPLPWVVAVGGVVTWAAGAWAAVRTTQLVAGPAAAPMATLVVLGCVLLTNTTSVAGSYIFGGGLQPSSLAGAALLWAIYEYARGRFGSSGVLLALGGAMHANFLVLDLAAFGAAHVLLGRPGLLPRLVRQLAPSALVFALTLPALLRTAGGPNAHVAREIFVVIRSPHHYVPRHFVRWLLPFWGWTVGGLVTPWRGTGVWDEVRRIRALLVVIVLAVTGATAVNLVTFVPALAQLFVYRLAPFGELLGQVFVAAWAARRLCAERVPGLRRPALALLYGSVAGAAVFAAVHVLREADPVPHWAARAAVAVACVALAVFVARGGAPAGVVGGAWAGRGVVCALVFYGALLTVRFPVAIWSSNVLRPDRSPASALYAWASHTPPDTRFVVPPDLSDFRLRSGRAIVADWKSTPILPDELVEWHRRMSALAGRPVRGAGEADSGYAAGPLGRLERVAAAYGAQYLVLRASAPAARHVDSAVAYRNADYVVLRAVASP